MSLNLSDEYEEDRAEIIAEIEDDMNQEVTVQAEFPELTESQKEDYALWIKRQHDESGEPISTNLANDEEQIQDMERMSKGAANYTFSTPLENKVGKYSRNAVHGARDTLSTVPEMTNKNEGYRGIKEGAIYLNEFNGHKGHYTDKITYKNNVAHSKRIHEHQLRPLRHDTEISEKDMTTRTFGTLPDASTSTQMNNNVSNITFNDSKRSFFIPSSQNFNVTLQNTNVSSRQDNYSY